MADDPPNLEAQGPLERTIWVTKSAIKKCGLDDVAKTATARLARTTYTRTLRFVPNREELPFLLNARGLVGTGAEIGVALGDFSEHILVHWRGARLVSIDPWMELPPSEYVDKCNMPQQSMEESYEHAKALLSRFGNRSEVWRETSSDGAKRIAPGTLDFVYIDARHTYEAVSEDLAAWFPRLRPGGIIAGHDYDDGYFAEGLHGVRAAVDEFFGRRELEVAHTHTDVPSLSWLVRVPT